MADFSPKVFKGLNRLAVFCSNEMFHLCSKVGKSGPSPASKSNMAATSFKPAIAA